MATLEEIKAQCLSSINEVAEEFKSKKGMDVKVPSEIRDEIIVAGVTNYFRQRWHNYSSNQGRRELVKKLISAAKAKGIDLGDLGVEGLE